jgi:hypothetical protein
MIGILCTKTFCVSSPPAFFLPYQFPLFLLIPTLSPPLSLRHSVHFSLLGKRSDSTLDLSQKVEKRSDRILLSASSFISRMMLGYLLF